MNQVEMSVTMQKHYGAKWISQKTCFRFSKHDRSFELFVKYGQSNSGAAVWIDSMYLEERVMPADDFGKVKNKILASLETKPKTIDEVRRWINKQLIAAFLDEHCQIQQATPLEHARGL